MKKIAAFSVLAWLCLAVLTTHAQSADSVSHKILNFPGKLLGRIRSKTAALNNQLTDQTDRYLKEMANREARMQKRLSAIDPAGAKVLFSGSAEKYAALQNKIKSDTGGAGRTYSGAYKPYLDSLQGSVKFLGQNPEVSGISGNTRFQAQVQGAGNQIQTYEAKLDDASQAKVFVQQRKQMIAQYVAEHADARAVLTEPLAAMGRQQYYFGQRLQQYADGWTSPDQLEQKALAILDRLPAFQTFMKENSMLGGLFNLPGGYGSPQSISGLQTKGDVAQSIESRLSTTDPNGASALQSNLQSAQSQLDGYKSKLSQLGSGNGDMDMPDFVPNDQKTKTFWKRLQYGTDFQTTHNNYYFPMVTDLGLSLGYKLGHDNIIGVGASYKVGWGNGIQHIAFSSQGVGLRSFLQVKIKGTFSATGGFEYNYTTPFTSYQQLKQLEYWTRSGLLGVTKSVAVKSKVFKNTSVSLLWDFLSYQQVPRTQPFLFRIGYVWH